MSVNWTFETARDLIVLPGELSDYPNTTVGEEVTFEFYLKDDLADSGEFQATGSTHGGVTGSTHGGVTGATLGSQTYNNRFSDPENAYNRLKEYSKYAGYASTDTTLASAYFSENTDFADTPVDSLVCGIFPDNDVDEARGIWGVLTSVDDTTEIFGAIARLDLSVFVLAEYSEYADEQAVRDAFESDF
jgi:hypothetical protein